MCNQDVCVYDICDGQRHMDFWADWCPETKLVVFGGCFLDVPDMPAETEPSQEEVLDWADVHDPEWRT